MFLWDSGQSSSLHGPQSPYLVMLQGSKAIPLSQRTKMTPSPAMNKPGNEVKQLLQIEDHLKAKIMPLLDYPS